MIKSLQNGQTVLTSGGIIGTIVAVNDDTLILRVKPDNLKIQVARSAVTSLVGTDEQQEVESRTARAVSAIEDETQSTV